MGIWNDEPASAVRAVGKVRTATGALAEFETPRALSVAEIGILVQGYAQAARNAKEAGFDGFENSFGRDHACAVAADCDGVSVVDQVGGAAGVEEGGGAHRFLYTGLRFSPNALSPSLASSVMARMALWLSV